ncbi:MAG: hypothetical protein P3W87_000800 [Gammaproteobacteria bacterium]|nr:hypothetical protein [Gammaproteobacteria bacterium]
MTVYPLRTVSGGFYEDSIWLGEGEGSENQGFLNTHLPQAGEGHGVRAIPLGAALGWPVEAG